MSTDNSMETKSTIVIENNDDRQFWKEEERKILEEWADKAQCFECIIKHIIFIKKKWILYNTGYYYIYNNWNC